MIHNDVWRERLTLTMDGLLIGTGWHPVERHEDGYFRWLGPEPQATLHIAPCRDRDNRLNMVIRDAADDSVLDGLSVNADGVPLKLTVSTQRKPWYITMVLPKDPSKPRDRETVLTLQVPATRPASEVFPGGKDARRIGFALQAIHVFPLARPLFVAEKFADPQPFDGLDYMRRQPGVRDAVVQGHYASAYDYYNQSDRTTGAYVPDLHARFDECPGDQFDILAELARSESVTIEQRLRQEIELLRGIVLRQGDTIRALQAAQSQQPALSENS